MTILYTSLRHVLPLAAGLSLVACASGPGKLAAQDVLLQGIAPQHVSLYANETPRAAEDDVCQTFYDNTVTFVGQPVKTSTEEILGTVFIAALAGGATFGVGALGIANPFAALSLAATTNQVVYEGGIAAMDAKDTVKSDLSPEVEIADAAMRLGCPQLSNAALKLAKIEAKENKKAKRKLAKLRKKNKRYASKALVCRDGAQNC